jgi:hypothetical protein
MKHSLVLSDRNSADAQGIVIPLLSGAMTGIAAGADVAGVRNLMDVPVVVDGIRIRWVTSTAFGTAQALAFRVNKVYGFTAVHDTGSPVAIQAHYQYQAGVQTDQATAAPVTTGARIPLTEISSVISATAAITNGTYTAEDTDEPEVFAVGAGSTLPGVYENWCPLVPMVLTKNTGLVINNHILMGPSGVGNLFIGIDCHRQG